MKELQKSITIVNAVITPETVQEIIRKASAINWGTHLLRWRYFDVIHEGKPIHRGALIPTALWRLLKRVCVEQEWSVGTNLERLNAEARSIVQSPNTEIYVYGYYRTDPPRLQWGSLSRESGIAVVYDMEADLIATVFKPEEGSQFFEMQIDAVRIDRKDWNV